MSTAEVGIAEVVDRAGVGTAGAVDTAEVVGTAVSAGTAESERTGTERSESNLHRGY